MGSIPQPLLLCLAPTAINAAGDGMLSLSVIDDVMMVNGSAGETVLTVTDMQGRCVAACQGVTLSLSSLPTGIYIVRASDGSRQVIKKIKK